MAPRCLLIAWVLCKFVPAVWAEEQGIDGNPLLTVGLLAELSGPSMRNGESCRQGYEVARAADHSGASNRIRFVYGDHQGDARLGVAEYKRLTTMEQAIAIISIRSQVGMALNPLSGKEGVPLFGIVGHQDYVSGNPFAYRFFPQVRVEGGTLARKAIEMGKLRMAIVTLEDEWTVSLEKAFINQYQRLGGRIVMQERILPGDAELLAIITRLRAMGADALFINVGVSQAGLMIRKVRELGLTLQLFANFWAAYDDVLKTAGEENAAGLIYVSVNLDKPKFYKQFKALFSDSEPSAATYCCYTALSVLLQALSDEKCSAGRAELVSCLETMDSFHLLDESLPLRGREVIYDIVTTEVSNQLQNTQLR